MSDDLSRLREAGDGAFWIAVEWVLSQSRPVDWKADYLLRLGAAAGGGGGHG